MVCNYNFEVSAKKLEILNLILKSYRNNKIVAFQCESGSGKSNLIKEVIKELKIYNKYECIYFNPLIENSSRKISMSLFDTIKKIATSQMSIKYDDYILNTKDFLNLKQFINDEINKKQKQYFIFIDEIDSLENKLIKYLLNLIKYNFNFDNITYILNYDEEVMQSILGKYFGKRGEYVSYIYLNKIIDISFNIKIASKSELVDYIEKEIKNIIEEKKLVLSEKELNKFKNIFKELYKEKIKTLRIANQYLYTIDMIDLRNKKNILNELIKEGVKIFYSKVYRNIDIKDDLIDEHSIRIAIEEFKNEGKVSSIEDRALLIEKTIESLLCERE